MNDDSPLWCSPAEFVASFPSVRERLEKELWVFDEKHLTLDVRENPGYEIDLEELRTSAEVLDLIIQVSHKTWADDALLASLVRCLDLLLEPQHYLCSWGKERGPIDPKAVIRRLVRPR